MRRLRVLAIAWLAAACAGPGARAAPALPRDSVYRIPALTLTDQDGRTFAFAALRGRPRLIGMFYASCSRVCPLEIETLERVRRKVARREGISVVLVSFDPAHDDVAVLRDVARRHHVSAPSFRLTRVDRGDQGMLAGVLGIAYRRLPNGDFSHDALVSLLDAEGRIVAKFDASGMPDAAFMQALTERGQGAGATPKR